MTGRPTAVDVARCSACGQPCHGDDDRLVVVVPSGWTVDDLSQRRFREMTVIEAACAKCRAQAVGSTP